MTYSTDSAGNPNPNHKPRESKTTTDNRKDGTAQCIYQFIDHKTGKRSEPFTGNTDTVQKFLNLRGLGEAPFPEDYILLVAVLDGNDTTIPATPLITCATFEEYNGTSTKPAKATAPGANNT